LKDLGAVVEEGDLQKEDDLRQQVEELQAKLEAQRLELEAARVQLPSPGTLYQTDAITEETVEEDQEKGDPQPGNARPGVVGDDALAAAGSSKVVKDGEVKSPSKQQPQNK
jgi:multidrug resistance efflux pump